MKQEKVFLEKIWSGNNKKRFLENQHLRLPKQKLLIGEDWKMVKKILPDH